MAKVLISIDDELLRKLDERAKRDGLSRSAFMSSLAAQAVETRRIDPAIRRAIKRGRAGFAEASTHIQARIRRLWSGACGTSDEPARR